MARKYEICQRVQPRYSNKMGPKKYEFWQLIAMYLYEIIYNLTRDIEEEFLVSEVLREALNLKDVPHYSTICKAVKRLKEEDLKRLLEESAKLLDVKLDIMAIDWIERGRCELLLCEEWKGKEKLE